VISSLAETMTSSVLGLMMLFTLTRPLIWSRSGTSTSSPL
jgi:hypothetical protein